MACVGFTTRRLRPRLWEVVRWRLLSSSVQRMSGSAKMVAMKQKRKPGAWNEKRRKEEKERERESGTRGATVWRKRESSALWLASEAIKEGGNEIGCHMATPNWPQLITLIYIFWKISPILNYFAILTPLDISTSFWNLTPNLLISSNFNPKIFHFCPKTLYNFKIILKENYQINLRKFWILHVVPTRPIYHSFNEVI